MRAVILLSGVLCFGALRTAALAQPAAPTAPTTPTTSTTPALPAPPAPTAGAAAAAPAAPQLPPAPDAPVCTGTLDVHVVDAVTHEEIAGALVRRDDVVVGDTNAAGHLELRGQCPGTFALQIELDGYALAQRSAIVEDRRVTSLEVELQESSGEVIVVEEQAPVATSMRATAVLSGAALERTRGAALAEALAEVPGVAMLRSGSGMAKPIVRGQYGRRLLLLVDSVRHRAQEWGLDHAPEIDPFIAERITVVRGAAGVQYGPDAIGGAVLVDPPALLTQPGSSQAELHVIGTANGVGGVVAARLRSATLRLPGFAWQLEGSFKRARSATTPDYALDNTGVMEGSLGATVGYRRGDAAYKLSYRRYQAELGVCTCLRMESAEDFYAQLERARPLGSEAYRSDFEIDRPSQAVVHDLALARGDWELGELGTLSSTLSFQHDHREEFEVVRAAVTGPQFNFRLFTGELETTLRHYPIHLNDHLHLRGTVGVVAMGQVHSYNGLPLVPDHRSLSGGGFAIERLIGHDFELEAGVRYDVLGRSAQIEARDFQRLVRSGQLAEDACGAQTDPVACDSVFHTVSASVGGLRQLTDAWAIKLELSTASRPPNPDEQYLNGSAPTFPVVGLGKPDLGSETTYSASTTTTYQGTRLIAEASAYANRIDDYIYFAPAIGADGAPIFDVLIRGTYPRFITKAVDAVFYGVDGGVSVAPTSFLEVSAQLSMVRARKLEDDSPLVFVPPDRLSGSMTYKPPARGALHDSFLTLSGQYVARQKTYDLAADFAVPPAAYVLLGAEAGTSFELGRNTLKVAVQGQNLLNQRYRDYTSLMRYFADQPGTQVLLRLSLLTSSLF